MSPSIELHIGELVLEGFPGLNRAELSIAVQTELTRLLAEHGLPNASDRRAPRLETGEFRLQADSNARPMASQIAQAIYGGLTQ